MDEQERLINALSAELMKFEESQAEIRAKLDRLDDEKETKWVINFAE